MKKINSNMRVAELDTLSDVLIRMYKDSSAAENALSKDTNLSLIMAEESSCGFQQVRKADYTEKLCGRIVFD